jgi:hypothetical protein
MNLDLNTKYCCQTNIDLYSSSKCEGLTTQAAIGRYLRIVSSNVENNAVRVCLYGDDYPGWLKLDDLKLLSVTSIVSEIIKIDRDEIVTKIPAIIAFAKAAMSVPNRYLWGGTVAPNYDCSGLMQAAFGSVGIWLPRDSYQQEIFTHRIEIDRLLPGDLIFFGTTEKTDHVALHLGDLNYIHSSGIQMGRNGIGIDILSDRSTDPIGKGYFNRFRCCGRVMYGYQGKT